MVERLALLLLLLLARCALTILLSLLALFLLSLLLLLRVALLPSLLLLVRLLLLALLWVLFLLGCRLRGLALAGLTLGHELLFLGLLPSAGLREVLPLCLVRVGRGLRSRLCLLWVSRFLPRARLLWLALARHVLVLPLLLSRHRYVLPSGRSAPSRPEVGTPIEPREQLQPSRHRASPIARTSRVMRHTQEEAGLTARLIRIVTLGERRRAAYQKPCL